MYWTTTCPSSGETAVFMRHLVLVILYGWLSGMQGMHTRQSSIQNNMYQALHKHSRFSWWWALGHPKHVEKRNKHTKKNCAPSWLYLQEGSLSIRTNEEMYLLIKRGDIVGFWGKWRLGIGVRWLWTEKHGGELLSRWKFTECPRKLEDKRNHWCIWNHSVFGHFWSCSLWDKTNVFWRQVQLLYVGKK